MAAAMVAMMLPTAVPFFVAYGRKVRRPAPLALVVATYSAVWAAIGVVAWLVMSQVMLPGGLFVAGIAIGFAGLYALTPWKRRGQAGCKQMCRQVGDDSALKQGLTYSINCVACSAGVMAAVIMLGMSNIALVAVGATVILADKLTGPWPRRLEVLTVRSQSR
jgi:predicted metal-binding membrane protein